MELLITLIVAAGLGLIPAKIAESKGYDFKLWWLYGWLIFIVALIHAALLPNKNEQRRYTEHQMFSANADELLKYKKLLEEGAITQDEYDAKKKQLLNI